VLTGAILAGGRSSRFGRNKAIEIFRGKRLIDWGIDSIRPFCDPILVVANDLSLYFDVHATLVRDILSDQGPLGGIYTALLFSPHDWVFARATDMPFLVPELLTTMLGMRGNFDAVVPLLDGWYEPLFALYHRRCFPLIADVLETDERKIISFYKKIKVREVTERRWRTVDPQGLSFKNVNTPEDLDSL
jgi:molybdopterin-guanine dinucleotide biosynthesis protein A